MFSKKNFFSSRLAKLIAIMAVFGLLIFFNPYEFFNPARDVVFQAAYPFKKTVSNVFFAVREIGDFIFSIGKLKKENEKQIEEIQSLKSRLAAMADMERENAFLREQLKLLPRNKFKLESSSVIARDQNGLGNWIEIDKGERNGLRKGMPVIVSEGIFVGKLGEVYSGTAKVVLTTNPESLINAVDAKSSAHGLVKGEYGLGIIFGMVLQTDAISIGDDIVTSEISQNIPRGLLVGKIEEIQSSGNQLFQQAVLRIPFKASDLQHVFVIREYNK